MPSPDEIFRDPLRLHALLGIEDLNALAGHPVGGASWEGFVLENLMGAAPPQALVYAVLVHILAYSTVTVLGLGLMCAEGLSLAKFEEGAEKVSLETKR